MWLADPTAWNKKNEPNVVEIESATIINEEDYQLMFS
jgi:hypothetical protein